MSRQHFRLDDQFISEYEDRPPAWGPLGYLVFKRTYARPVLEEGRTEEWFETVRRVVEGTFSVQKTHCHSLGIRFDESKAMRSARKMYDMIFNFKFLPPGRGLWIMGTDHLFETGSAALNNCGFISTQNVIDDFAYPFSFIMDMSMLGVGVGFDTRGAGTMDLVVPEYTEEVFIVEDSREGWVDLIRTILNSFVGKAKFPLNRDYSKVRPAGSPINGFGGTASGPDPLERLVQDIEVILKPAEGSRKTLTSTHIVDVANAIGKCVIAGNVRRTALIGLADPGDMEFVSLKDGMASGSIENPYSKTSYELENEDALAGPMSWRWASNNSVMAKVGMDYGPHVEHLLQTGEPGFVWLENCKRFSRMTGEEDNVDSMVKGVNPCVPEHAWINTQDGLRQVRDLVGHQFSAMVNGKAYKSTDSGFFSTGIKEVFRVRTSRGQMLESTDNHPVLRLIKKTQNKMYTEWTEVGHLKPGDSILLPTHEDMEWENVEGDTQFQLGWLTGDFIGNGCFANNGLAKSEYWGDHKWDMLSQAVQYIHASLPGSDRVKGYEIPDRDQVGCSSSQLAEFLDQHGVRSGNKTVTDSLMRLSDAFLRGMVRGLFDADGTVIGDKQKSVRLSSVDADMLTRVQIVLSRFGIRSTIYHNRREAGQREMPDGKGGMKTYECQAMHELVVSRSSIPVFEQVIGLSKPDKVEKLEDMLQASLYHPRKDRVETVVTSIESVGNMEVYDCTIPDAHEFECNAIRVHNCSEQTLEHAELCCLVETFPSLHNSREEFMETLEMAYLYAKTVTLIPTHCDLTNAVMMKNRRIGTSMTGVVDAISKFGIGEFEEWCQRGYDLIQEIDRKYSDWMCIRTSIKTTTVKPSGCRPWNAMTLTSRGVLTLEELFEMSEHEIGEQWHDMKKEVSVFQDDGQTNRITKTYWNGKSPLVTVDLSFGMQLESTPNHRWYVKETVVGGRKNHAPVNDWIEAERLQPGDIVDINLGAYTNEKHSSLSKVNSLSLKMRGDAIDIKQPDEMNEDLAWLFGYLWGDGSMSPNRYRIRFIDQNKYNLEKVCKIVNEQFGIDAESVIRSEKHWKDAYTLDISSKMLWHWMIRNDIFKHYEDRIDLVPKCVRSSSRSDIIAFISGLMDADGCVSKTPSGFKLVLSTSDKEFSKHIQELCLSVGIIIGRSHNTKGESFQNRRSMWLMTTSFQSDNRSMETLIQHSTKCRRATEREDFNGWAYERDAKITLTPGKVLKVSISDDQVDTYDIEVESDHWYYSNGVKSHNTVSLLPGVSPGIHFPHAEYYIRRVRLSENSELVEQLKHSGYHVERDVYSHGTMVVEIPVHEKHFYRSKGEVSIWEQLSLAAFMQRVWSDNAVSVTVTFKEEEKRDIEPALNYFQTQLKAVSFLPFIGEGGSSYAQLPYETISKETYEEMRSRIKSVDFKTSRNESIERFCDGDTCEIVPNSRTDV